MDGLTNLEIWYLGLRILPFKDIFPEKVFFCLLLQFDRLLAKLLSILKIKSCKVFSLHCPIMIPQTKFSS